jgi:hypothetical protein
MKEKNLFVLFDFLFMLIIAEFWLMFLCGLMNFMCYIEDFSFDYNLYWIFALGAIPITIFCERFVKPFFK